MGMVVEEGVIKEWSKLTLSDETIFFSVADINRSD